MLCGSEVHHVDIFLIVDGDFTEDVSVILDDHAVFADDDELEFLSVVATGGDGAIVVGDEIEVRANDGVAHEEFDHIEDEPIGEHKQFVGGEDGEAPHDEGLYEDVAMNAGVEVVEESGGAETTETSVEETAQNDGADGNFEEAFHGIKPLCLSLYNAHSARRTSV